MTELYAEFERILLKRSVRMNMELDEFRKIKFPDLLYFNDFISGFSIYLAKKFESKLLSYDEVDDSLTALMVWLDYNVPSTAWKIFEFFEKFEIEPNPAEDAFREVGSFLATLSPVGS